MVAKFILCLFYPLTILLVLVMICVDLKALRDYHTRPQPPAVAQSLLRLVEIMMPYWIGVFTSSDPVMEEAIRGDTYLQGQVASNMRWPEARRNPFNPSVSIQMPDSTQNHTGTHSSQQLVTVTSSSHVATTTVGTSGASGGISSPFSTRAGSRNLLGSVCPEIKITESTN